VSSRKKFTIQRFIVIHLLVFLKRSVRNWRHWNSERKWLPWDR